MLQKNELKVNKKCSFGLAQLEFLGHIISAERAGSRSKKNRSNVAWPIPKDTKGPRGFIGLMGYYRCFIWGYG